MPQGEGGGGPREQNQRSQLVFPSSSAELTSNHSLLNSISDNARGRTLSYEDLSRCFHLPINAAAKELGVCVTALKKQCRKHGVPRWPHRKLKSLDKLKEKLEKEEATAADKEYYKHEIHSIAQKKDHIFRSSAASAAAAPSSSAGPNSSPAAAHPHAAHQLVVGRPVPHFHQPGQKGPPAALPPHCTPSQGRTPALVPFAVDGDKPQMVPASLVMPFPHMPGAPPGAIAGPNGTIIAQPAHPGQQFPLCGIYGCDCYMNNGVSSRMYHSPLPTARLPTNSAGSPNLRSGPPATANGHPTAPGPMPNVHYFNPAAYAYGPAIAHMGPYQNMVQVNVMEQPSFPHGARPAPAAPVPGSSSVGNSSGSQSQAMLQHSRAAPPPLQAPAGYEVYANVPHAANGPGNGFVYSPFIAPNVHYNGVMEHPPNGAPVQSGYWAEVPQHQHQQNSPGNLVTMCNQTVHHHHHHGMDTAATASPVLTDRRQGVDTTSSKTNNSEARDQASSGVKPNDKAENAQSANAGDVSSARDGAPRTAGQQDKEQNGADKQKPSKETRPAAPAANAKAAAAKEKESAKAREPTQSNNVAQTGVSQPRRIEARIAPVRMNGIRPAPMANGAQGASTEDSSETSNYSRRGNDEKRAKDAQNRKWNKRPRISSEDSPVHPANARTTTNAGMHAKADAPKPPNSAPGSGSEAKGGKKSFAERDTHDGRGGARAPEAKRARLERGLAGAGSAAAGGAGSGVGGPDFAKRYDHVVHQCLGLQTAHWCTDLNFKVNLALGPKALLGLAGVPSLGRSVLDVSDTALEDTRAKYPLSARGQRFEWIATSGSARYLVVLSPYRKRNAHDISGVSGLIVELKIIQALPK